MIGWIVWMGSAAAAPPTCAVGNSSADVVAAVVRGEEAFRLMNAEDLEKAATDATWLLGCLDEPLTRADVAAFMRMKGYAAFVQKDRAGALVWFDTAKAALPSYVIPTTVVSENHPLRGLYDSAEGGEPLGTVPVPKPSSGAVLVSGSRADVAPTNRPWVFQQVDARGKVLQTVLVAVDDPMPSLIQTEAVDPGPTPPDKAPKQDRSPGDGPELAFVARFGPAIQRATDVGNRMGALGVGATVPVGGPVSLDLGAVAAITGGRGFVAVQPVLRVGARAEIGSGATRGYAGLAGLGTLGDDGFGPGAGALGGLRSKLGERALLEFDLLAGWTSRPGAPGGGLWSMVSVGIGGAL